MDLFPLFHEHLVQLPEIVCDSNIYNSEPLMFLLSPEIVVPLWVLGYLCEQEAQQFTSKIFNWNVDGF